MFDDAFLKKFLKETFTEKKKVSPSFGEEALRICQLNETLKDNIEKTGKSIWYWIGISLLIPAIIIGLMGWVLTYGFVTMKLWLWFIVPIFDVKPITCLQAAGIMLLVHFGTHEYPADNDEGRTDFQKKCRIVAILLIPWLTLLVGYIIHCFI